MCRIFTQNNHARTQHRLQHQGYEIDIGVEVGKSGESGRRTRRKEGKWSSGEATERTNRLAAMRKVSKIAFAYACGTYTPQGYTANIHTLAQALLSWQIDDTGPLFGLESGPCSLSHGPQEPIDAPGQPGPPKDIQGQGKWTSGKVLPQSVRGRECGK